MPVDRTAIKMAICLIVLCVIWGLTFTVMKVGISYIPPLTFSALRFIIGGVLLIGLTLVLRIGIPAKKDWSALVVLGLLQTALTFGLVFYAMQTVPAGMTSVLLYSYPIIVNLMAR